MPSAQTCDERVNAFEPRDGGTEVIVVHESSAREELRVDHELGWKGCLENLAALLAST